jgi:hypothetical protein
MKYTIKLLIAIMTLSFCTVAARAGQVDDLLGSVQKNGVGVLCRKASARSGIFSLRSFEGNLCKTDYLAALAEAICAEPDTDDYKNSGCHKNAQKVLQGKDPTEVLKAAIKQGVGKSRALICGVPGFPDAIKAACGS